MGITSNTKIFKVSRSYQNTVKMKGKFNVKRKELILDVVITKEKIEGKEFFVAQGVQLDVASQGLTLEEAIENIKDAAEIVLEDSKEKRLIMLEQESSEIAPMMTRVFI